MPEIESYHGKILTLGDEIEFIKRQREAEKTSAEKPLPTPFNDEHSMEYNFPSEAFCLLTYTCKDCGAETMVWNARDGATPIGLRCLCGQGMYNWNHSKTVRAVDRVLYDKDFFFDNCPIGVFRIFALASLIRENKFSVEDLPEIMEQYDPDAPTLFRYREKVK